MSEHVLHQLAAYHDGELSGAWLRRVEAHLPTCAVCQAELEALRSLSAQLQASPPMPARTPPEQFVAQVGLRLPSSSGPVSGRARLRRATGLWLPLGVLAFWAFGQAVLAVGALALGLGAVPAGLPVVLPGGLVVELPLLLTLSLPPGLAEWAALIALNVGLTAVVAVLLWGCLAGWLAAREPNLSSSGQAG